MKLTLFISSIINIFILPSVLIFKKEVAYIYTNDSLVTDLIVLIIPLVCLGSVFDTF